MKIAIVQDALVVSGGAERVAAALCQAFPDAEFYTSVYLKDKTLSFFKDKKVHTLPGSFLVKNERQFKRLYFLWFTGFFLLDVSSFDVVISSSTYAAKFIRRPQNGVHIGYLHSPFRFLWKRESYQSTSLPYNRFLMQLIDAFLPLLRYFDKKATKKIDCIIANSDNMARFISETYAVKTEIIYPPIVFQDFYAKNERQEYFLYVGRLISYKRVDLAIEACKILDRKLKIVGDGPELNSLKAISDDHIEFLGSVSEEELHGLYSEAKGLFFPGAEDFGLVAVEAQASGCPIIAYRSGGALETVIEGKTGVFFDEQTIDNVVKTVNHFDTIHFNIETIKENARCFDIQNFCDKIRTVVEERCKASLTTS